MSAKAAVLAVNAGKVLNILGDTLIVKISGRDSGGELFLGLAEAEPGSGPPPHIHQREDETFYCLEGEFEGFCGDQKFRLTPGMTAFLPRGVVHAWKCSSSKRGRMIVAFTPATFEGFFEEVGALTPTEQSDIPRVLAIGKKYGLEFLPPQ